MATIERVLIDNKGTAVSPEMASQLGINPYITFFRDDGYTLGAPKNLRTLAHSMWTWSYFNDGRATRPMSEYWNYINEEIRRRS